MRITGGQARGRRLFGPPGRKVAIRPTGDRVREAIFAILGSRTVGSSVLDLFAGTGALGIEALSRGASQAVFVDRSRLALNIVAANLEHCLPGTSWKLFRLDLDRPTALEKLSRLLPPQTTFDLIFLDPPYEKRLAEKTLSMVDNATILSATGLVVVEEQASQVLPDSLDRLRLTDRRRYGETGIWIYQPHSLVQRPPCHSLPRTTPSPRKDPHHP